MDISDFKIGQTVVILGDGGVIQTTDRTEAFVTKVGRQYVHVVQKGGGYPSMFQKHVENKNYLIEVVDIGSPRILLPSTQAADDYCERKRLITWLRNATSWSKCDKYTLAQLKAVNKILEGDNND